MAKKILFNALQISPRGAGISRYSFEITKELTKISNHICLALFEKRPSFFSQLPEDSLLTFRGVSSNKRRILIEQILLPIRFANFSLVHYPDFAGPFLSKIPFIITVHDISFLRHPETFTFGQRYWKKYILSVCLKKARRIICISEFTAKELIDIGTDPGKITVIYSGVNFIPFYRNDVDRNLQKWSIKKPYILYVGTLEPRKNIVRLISAFAQLKKQGIKHSLVVVGKKGWLFDKIFSQIKRLNIQDDIIFTGYLPDSDLAMIYSKADVLAFISLYEGFGFPPLEAMTCGTPVVVSNTSSLPEVCGDAAHYIDPLDINDIAQGIHKVLMDVSLRRDLIQKGLERVKYFSWEKTARETLRVYEEILRSTGCVHNKRSVEVS